MRGENGFYCLVERKSTQAVLRAEQPGTASSQRSEDRSFVGGRNSAGLGGWARAEENYGLHRPHGLSE